MKDTTYPGQVSSALARVRKTLKEAGYPLGRVVGAYSPFCNAQTYIEGVNVSRVGCGRSIALRYVDAGPGRGKRLAEWLPAAVTLLRDSGLLFDDRGWLVCDWD